MDKKQLEQTLVLIKPDALKNSITGFILSQLSEFHTGARFAAAKIVNVNRFLAEEHYAEHKGKVFYEALLNFITGKAHYPDKDRWKRRVIAIVYLGHDVLKTIRSIAGPTNPHQARDERPGCLRSLGTLVPIKDENGNTIGSTHLFWDKDMKDGATKESLKPPPGSVRAMVHLALVIFEEVRVTKDK